MPVFPKCRRLNETLCVPWHTNVQVAFRHRSDSAANYWHDWNVGIIVGRIAASPINSRTNLSVKPSAEDGAEGFKRDRKPQWTERRSLGPAESRCDLLRSEHSPLASSSCSSLCPAGEMFVDDRILTLFKRNAHHTLTYWSVFFSFGLCIAFLGPTILDLQCQTSSTLSQITWVFFSQQFCLLIGSSVGGVFKRTWVFCKKFFFLLSWVDNLRKPSV